MGLLAKNMFFGILLPKMDKSAYARIFLKIPNKFRVEWYRGRKCPYLQTFEFLQSLGQAHTITNDEKKIYEIFSKWIF